MKDDIQFLKDLQGELKTQENDGQASPRFWVIRDYRVVPTHEEYGMQRTMYWHNDGDHTEFETLENLKEFLTDYYLEDDEQGELKEILEDESTTFDDLWNFAETYLNDDGYFNEVPVKEESFIVPDTMFLTKKEAKRHLETNHYHYTSKAHTYAMTAWRAPKVERLLKILGTFDWNKIEEIAEEKSFFLNAYVEKVMNE
ncbi:hypothetical protein ACIQD3_04540 [Peribacillus loiseleuriae]|uniref:hypothetical protein n=1 Tax=Peribacillus loiseleuriae TaxID=1679170 RepID=UPI0038159C2B